MKQKIIASIVVIVICLMVGGIGADDEPVRRVMDYIAVLDLNCGKIFNKDECSILTDTVIDELVKAKKYKVVDRANRDKILSEVGWQQTGCVEGACTVEMGRQLGVGKIVIGKVSKFGEMYIVSLQIVNVETALVEKTVQEKCKKCEVESVVDTVANATRKLMGQAPVSTHTLPSSVETPPKAEEIKFISASPEQQASCGPDMVYVPAGWFMMGCNLAKDSQCKADEHPYHSVYLDAFCIDKYEYPNQAGVKARNKVNWNEAYRICTSQDKQLPTEAQWAKAARGTDGQVYPWGDSLGNEKRKALKKRYPSGTYSWNVSPYGVYDMSGSLWEWVSDWYNPNYYSKSPNRNPVGPASGQVRVLRGGTWRYTPDLLRSSSRTNRDPAKISYGAGGFRCAKTP